jgi:parallel beta-helix repeat protein
MVVGAGCYNNKFLNVHTDTTGGSKSIVINASNNTLVGGSLDKPIELGPSIWNVEIGKLNFSAVSSPVIVMNGATNCWFHDFDIALASSGTGFSLVNSSSSTIERLRVIGLSSGGSNDHGITVDENSTSNVVRNVLIQDVETQLLLGGKDNAVENSKFLSSVNGIGVYVYGDDLTGNKIIKNNFENCKFGVYLTHSSGGNVASGNFVLGNVFRGATNGNKGVYVDVATENIFEDNQFWDWGTYAIQLTANATYNLVTHNIMHIDAAEIADAGTGNNIIQNYNRFSLWHDGGP